MPRFYANPSPIYQPAMRLISAITRANPAVVTTTFDHDYLAGTIVRLDIPPYLGMPQADQQVVEILVSLGVDSFSVSMDSREYEAFVIPGDIPPLETMTAMAVPIGERNDMLTAATENVLP